MQDKIVIKGARVHNLKNISLEIPRNKLVVFTGLSGSGKSSLAFDTLYAEGQRRYVESLSAYARQFLGLMDKPDVDQIDGLSPAISIDQKTASHNPRSTVGTITEIHDYLRLLYARVGIQRCPECDAILEKQTHEQIYKQILKLKKMSQISILAPMVRDKKGEHKAIIEKMEKAGFIRIRVDKDIMRVADAKELDLDKQKKHSIEIVVDRMRLEGDKETNTRISDSLATALDLGNGLVIINVQDEDKDYLFSEHLTCLKHNISLPPLEPRMFSFNSPHGACETCSGLGIKKIIDPDLVIPNKKLSLAEGAIRPWARIASNQGYYFKIVEEVAKAHNFSTLIPVSKLSKKEIDIILNGTGTKQYKIEFDSERFSGEYAANFEGVIPNLMRRYLDTDSDYIRTEIEKYMREFICPSCHGKRLKPAALAVTVGGVTIDILSNSAIDELGAFFKALGNGGSQVEIQLRTPSIENPIEQLQSYMITPLKEKDLFIAKQILREIINRLQFLENVGVGYLTLDRAATTLSGGEAQRIRLATQIGSSLAGVLYILDEPSIGLHHRDNTKLIATLKNLRDIGNSVVVVEHDEDTILEADYVVDIGPGAGEHGGVVIAASTPEELMKNTKSITGQYLSGKKRIEMPKKLRDGSGKFLKIIGATEHNLRNVTAEFPLGKFVCVTGVSGSGKSTLITDILSKKLRQHFYQALDEPGKYKEITGLEHIDKIIDIDQSPIGRTPRSNPATYTGLFTPIRDLFAELPESKVRGYNPGRFSFNIKGGRCETCQGDGLVKIEMNFLPDVYVECEECHGARYNSQTLEIYYKSKNISNILNMTVEEAMEFFRSVPAIHSKLVTLNDVGLGYIKLGQSATTLSGGEAQRIKLATELSRRATGSTLYVLDEPTTGLHFDDINRLLLVLHRLADKGNTVLVIEHNLDVIKCSDWVIDMGPEGGNKGGEIIGAGTPFEIAQIKNSYTGQYLKKLLEKEKSRNKKEK